jgi:energy-coupling factor transporter ATP-binding protein EcfA2
MMLSQSDQRDDDNDEEDDEAELQHPAISQTNFSTTGNITLHTIHAAASPPLLVLQPPLTRPPRDVSQRPHTYNTALRGVHSAVVNQHHHTSSSTSTSTSTQQQQASVVSVANLLQQATGGGDIMPNVVALHPQQSIGGAPSATPTLAATTLSNGDDDVFTEPASFQNKRKFQKIAQQWDFEQPCQYCGKVYLKSVRKPQRKTCCINGEATIANGVNGFPQLDPLPDIFVNKLRNMTHHYSSNSAYYNNILSIASTGIDNGRTHRFEQIAGDSAVKLNGRTYHYIRNVNGNHHGALRYFTFDDTEELANHAQFLNGDNHLNPVVRVNDLEELFQQQKLDNVYVHDIQQVAQRIGNFTHLLTNNIVYDQHSHTWVNAQSIVATTNTAMARMNISGFSADNATGNLEFRYALKGQHGVIQNNTLGPTDPNVEPLCYPLFHWYGEQGWSPKCRIYDVSRKLPFMDYLACRLHMAEQNDDRFLFPNQNGNLIRVNRFQIMSRLMQHYVVENVSRALDYRLDWHRKRQGEIFNDYQTTLNEQIITEAEHEAIAEEHELFEQNGADQEQNRRYSTANSSKSFLSASFHGGKRHLQNLAKNALLIVSELDAPTMFLTLTFNPDWPEIKDMLLQGQTIFQRPDIATQVFQARLKAMIHNIRSGKYCGRSEPVYILRVIEYQHRGLPHAHVVFRLGNHPNTEEERITYIDKYISARFPNIRTASNEQYCKLIEKHMIHGCSCAVNGCRKEAGGKCKYGYDTNVTTNTTTIDERGYPKYRRPKPEDLRVVPHNRDMLMDWQGHCNLEFCGRSYAVVYLYNYLFKGNQKIKVKLDNTDDVHEEDEITLYLRGRMLSSMDAVWRIFGYQTYPASYPSVTLIRVMLEEDMIDILSKQKLCDLAVYFERPHHDNFAEMLFTQFYKEWDYSYKLPSRYTEFRFVEPANPWEVGIFHVNTFINPRLYVYRRVKPQDNIVRLGMLYISAGEIWYLRLLLMHFPTRWYDSLKIVDMNEYSTFQAAAVAHGLVEHENEAFLCFRDAAEFDTSQKLRSLFIQLTKEGWATVAIFENHHLLTRMMDTDLLPQNDNNFALAKNLLLIEFQKRFVAEEKSLALYGLPEPEDMDTMLDREKLKYDPAQQLLLYNEFIANRPLNQQQQDAFNQIVHLFHNNQDNANGTVFLIQGQAGSGKSTFAKALTYYCRGNSGIVLGCASTGLAASVYQDMGFDTAHGLFSIPVIDDSESFDQELDLKCKFEKNQERADLLRAANIFIWDEIGSQHVRDFASVFSAMHQFQGKILILMGDVQQIAPVVLQGSKHQTVAASVYCSDFVPSFIKVNFTQNMRLLTQGHPDELQYAQLINDIGSGKIDENTPLARVVTSTDATTESTAIALAIPHFINVQEALHWSYPGGFDPNDMHGVCILAATNKLVDEWNELVQNMNANETHVLKSYDKICDVDDPHKYIANMINEQLMNDFHDHQSPPHELKLKVDDICILLRHVNKDTGYTNNRRVRIICIHPKRIVVRRLDATDASTDESLPRYRFKCHLGYNSFTMMRSQFPLRLAYSLTFNKAQGQEFKRIILDLRRPAFSHGHLYVALSRIRSRSNIRLFAAEENLTDNNEVLTDNVVYKKILSSLL